MGSYIPKLGEPKSGQSRLVTRREHALVKKYGVKRTYHISKNKYNEFSIFINSKKKGVIIFFNQHHETIFNILKEYWSKK